MISPRNDDRQVQQAIESRLKIPVTAPATPPAATASEPVRPTPPCNPGLFLVPPSATKGCAADAAISEGSTLSLPRLHVLPRAISEPPRVKSATADNAKLTAKAKVAARSSLSNSPWLSARRDELVLAAMAVTAPAFWLGHTLLVHLKVL